MGGSGHRSTWCGRPPHANAAVAGDHSDIDAPRLAGYRRRLRLITAGTVPAGRAGRVAIVGLTGMAVDFLAFQAFFLLGAGLNSAQILSFGLATLFNAALNARWAFAAEDGKPLPRSGDHIARLLVVALLALALRGGVLACATGLLGLPAPSAILFAIGAAAMVSTAGAAFFVLPSVRSPATGAARWRVAAIGIVGYSVALRLMFLGTAELLPQEAYYWNYAQHLDIGYLDHPPMVAWLISAGTALFGNNEFGVRIAAWLCWGVTAFFSFGLAGRLFGRKAAFVCVLLVAALPFYFGTGLVMTPDAPLTACWAGALFFMEGALRGGRRRAWWGVGICIGLGLLSKYTIALLGPAVLLFMLLDARARVWFRRPEPYLAAALALVLFAPVIMWNVENGLASFAFQSTRRIEGAFRFSLPELLLGVAGLLTPTGLVAAFAALWLRERGVRPQAPGLSPGATRDQTDLPGPWLFVGLFTLVPLAVFVAYSLFHMARLNWTGPLWLAVLPAIAAGPLAPTDHAGPLQRHLQRAFMPTLAISLILYGLGLNYLVAGLPGLGHVADVPALPVAWRAFGGQAAAIADEVRSATGEAPLLIGLDTYNIASELAFYANDKGAAPGASVGRGVLDQPSLMYGYWYSADTLRGRPAILFAFNRRQIDNPLLAAHLSDSGEVQQRDLVQNGRVKGHFYYRVGRLRAQPSSAGAAQATVIPQTESAIRSN